MEFVLNDFPDTQLKPGRQVFTSNFKGRKKDCIKIIRYLPGVIKHGAPEHFFITAKPEMNKASFISIFQELLKIIFK
nr:hypothetical protein [uncultured Methanobrevibacter sp.]